MSVAGPWHSPPTPATAAGFRGAAAFPWCSAGFAKVVACSRSSRDKNCCIYKNRKRGARRAVPCPPASAIGASPAAPATRLGGPSASRVGMMYYPRHAQTGRNSMRHVMRLVLALCLCLLSFAPASSAEQTVAPDGFSIGILNSSAFGPFQPLSEATIESFHLSGEERQIVRQLKRLVVSSDQAVLDDL